MPLFRRKKKSEEVEAASPAPSPQPPSSARGPAASGDLLAHRSEKALTLERDGTYVFVMRRRIPKPEVKREIERLYGVKVAKVSIVHLPDKMRRRGQHRTKRSGLRKAVVRVRQGERIDLGL